MKKIKIITHSGRFHADEIFAVALLGLFYKTDIKRKTTVSSGELNDKNIIIIDIGNNYSEELNNYDHHHNSDIEASNVLVLNSKLIPFPNEIKLLLYEKIFSEISNIDRGICEKKDILTFNQIINKFNFLKKSFYIAAEFAKNIIESNLSEIKQFVKTEEMIKTSSEINGFLLFDNQLIPTGWREITKQLNLTVKGIITPNNRGGWQIVSFNSDIFPIPPNSNQLFLHQTGFLAVYPDKQSAVNHALNL